MMLTMIILSTIIIVSMYYMAKPNAKIDGIIEEHTNKAHENLTEWELEQFWGGACPDCGKEKLIEGPCGGASINIYCRNIACESKFNDMCPFGVERITDRSPNKNVAHTKPLHRVSPYR